MALMRRKAGNGIKKGSVSQVNVAAKDAPIGRSSEEQIDFTIVDTWLASGSQLASSSGSSGPARARAGSDPHKMISSTISRYACRIIIDRENYDKAFLYAAGFDSVKNIFLGDGSLIDLCGATLLWRTADGLRKSPTAQELEMALDRLNAGKPQCPVNLNTLIIPKKKSSKGGGSRQPYVYLRCGHVQGKHEWGHHATSTGQQSYKCPICLAESERVIQLTMGMESSFHLDSGDLDHAFNPCGHVASLNTVR
ncbi:Pellino [Teladorsagia circumcincta]|uniref:Pellino n=1 Tax=Teladorsagia circumcincta TaxID=45464 RepID=A0A2G9U2I9_TELCI|nr:Pellino [Teladorsagia circumcincta]